MKITSLVCLCALLSASCNKNQTVSHTRQQTNFKAIDINALVDLDAMTLTSFSADEFRGSCPPIRSITLGDSGVYPWTERIDYGVGCYTPDSFILRSGAILRHYEVAPLDSVGGIVETTYDNYKINGTLIGGKSKITHVDSTGLPGDLDRRAVFSLVSDDRTTNDSTGQAFTTIIDKRVVNLENNGHAGTDFLHGWLKVTGTVDGSKTAGSNAPYQYSSVLDAVIYKHCAFSSAGTPVSGTSTYTFDPVTVSAPWLVEYGGPNICNDLAVITINGVATEVTLPLQLP